MKPGGVIKGPSTATLQPGEHVVRLRRCTNCKALTYGTTNNYCEPCAERFRRWGMPGFLHDDGTFSP